MRRPGSSSKNVLAALVAAAFGLTAGTALAETTTHANQTRTAASHPQASKKSVSQLTSPVKQEKKEMRVASAEHGMRSGEHKAWSHVHPRKSHAATTTPSPR
jgi:hypothetical protein